MDLEKSGFEVGAGENAVVANDTEKTPPQTTTTSSRRHLQSLERYINLSSVVNFNILILASWESFAVTFQFALTNGGPATIVYGCILAVLGATAVAISMAELSSIDPTVGAQYRWSANLAPCYPRFWGLVQGWITVFAWIFVCSGPPSIISNLITALAIFNYPDYEVKRWHTAFIMWAVMTVPFITNLWFRKVLNAFELIGGIGHVVFFVISITTLAVLGKRSTPDFVFKTLTHASPGWENPGVAFGIGLLTVTFSMTGFDGVLHMSDEVKKVRSRVPRSMIISCPLNGIMMFAFVLTLLFTIGDIDKVTTTNTGLPLIEVYYEATGSKAATNALVAMPAIITFFALFNSFASVSRLVWQFARDNGLPFSEFFAYVHPTLKLPVNALGLVGTVIFLLAIIYIGSATAFNALISLQAIALHISYFLPVLFLLLRKLRGPPPPYGPFKLGRKAIPIHIFALCYLIYVIVWMPFPTVIPFTADTFNYAGPMVGVIILGSLLDWSISGRKRFDMPVAPYVE